MNSACELATQVVFNGSMFTISQSTSDAILLEDNASLMNSTNAVLCILTAGVNGINMDNQSSFTNRGYFSVTLPDTEGINMDDASSCFNYGTMHFELVDGNDGIDMDDDASIFDNYGTISIEDITDTGEGIEVDDGTFTNHPSGMITMTKVTGDALRVEVLQPHNCSDFITDQKL